MFSIPDVAFLLFSVISLLFYIYTLLILIRKRRESPFNNHFFRLFISLGLADLCSGLNAYLMHASTEGWINWGSLYRHPVLGDFIKPFPIVGYVFLGICQYIGVLTLALNRFYNVEASLWTERKQKLALVAQWVVPTLAILPYVSQDFYVVVGNSSGITITIASPDRSFSRPYMMVVSLSQVIIVIVVAVLYCRIYSSIRRIKNDFAITEDNRSELKLAMVGLILLALMLTQQALLVSIVASGVLRRRALQVTLHILFHHLSIVFALINPLVLLGCSQPTREAMFGICSSSGIETEEPVEMKDVPRPQALKARPARISDRV